jgi:predicted RNase H-like nuclease (RuvC/YqgF family)
MQRLKDGYYEFKIRNRSLESDNNKLKKENEKLILVQGDNAIEHAAEITGLKREISTLKRELEELRTKNNKYSRVAHDALDAGYEAANTIRHLEEENSRLKTELEERKNKRSPRWPSDVMRICVLESKVDELTRENERLRYSQPWMYERSRYSQPWMYGMSGKETINRIFGVNGTIHKLREENKKLKDALEFCQKEASSAREHAHNVEVNAERIRLGID